MTDRTYNSTYVVKVGSREKTGFWWKRMEVYRWRKVAESKVRSAALKYAIDYPFWGNEIVLVQGLGGRILFSKKGGQIVQDYPDD